MADIFDASPVLDARQKAFTIEGVGEFVLHRPNVGDTVAIGKRVTVLGGGQMIADVDAAVLIKAQAVLETVADEKPRGFKFAEVEDPTAIFTFWGEYSEWLESFRPSKATDTSA
jgi:hypothetical protein